MLSSERVMVSQSVVIFCELAFRYLYRQRNCPILGQGEKFFRRATCLVRTMNRKITAWCFSKVRIMKVSVVAAAWIAVAACGVGSSAQAGTIIPYPTPGTINSEVYSFTAAATGVITAFFAGSDAGHTDTIGMRVNGVPTGIIGLNNHTSAIGDSIVLGNVNAGDVLTFFLVDANTASTWFSDANLNVDGKTQHVYSAPYDGLHPPLGAGIPAGTYVGFEDLSAAQGGDFDYNDDSFVFTNVATSSTPLPAALPLFATGIGGLVLLARRRNKRRLATPV